MKSGVHSDEGIHLASGVEIDEMRMWGRVCAYCDHCSLENLLLRPQVMPVEKSETAVLRHAVAQGQVVQNEQEELEELHGQLRHVA